MLRILKLLILFALPMNAYALTKYENFSQISKMAYFCAQKSGFRTVDDENNFGTITGFNAADLNLIALKNFDNTLIKKLKKEKFPFSYLPTEKTEKGFEKFMKSNGLIKIEEATAHEFFDFLNYKYKENNKIIIKKVTTSSELKDFARIAEVAFSIPQKDSFKFLFSTLAYPQMQLFIAFIDGNPAGSAMLFIDNDVAEMAWDGVLPEYRKKGVATAMLEYRLKIAKDMGAKIAVSQNFLTSSGYYKREGFKSIGEPVPVYVWGSH